MRDAITSRRFAALYAACLICSFGLFVPFVHLVPYALDHGVSPSAAVLLLGTIGVGSTAGRFVLGGLADRMGREPALLMMFAGMAFSLVIWVLSTGLGAGRLRVRLRRVLRRIRRNPAGARDGLLWRSQRQRHHRHSLHECGLWHAGRSQRRWIRLRSQP